MKLFELFNKPTKVEWDTDDRNMAEAYFEIDDKQYLIYFERMNIDYLERMLNFEIDTEDVWMIEFSRSGFIKDPAVNANRSGITGTGDAYNVFATVLMTMNAFKDLRKVEYFVFSASEPSRVSLYSRLASKLGKDVKTVPTKAGNYFLVKV
jgi:hypothetical protein